MTFYALEARYVPKIYGVCERFVTFVAGFAFAISQAAQVDRVLNEQSLIAATQRRAASRRKNLRGEARR